MEQLQENARTFWRSAELVHKARDYTSATILYFKCMFLLLDMVILKNMKEVPKDHAQRFRILESSFHDLFVVLDKLFFIYRDTYSVSIEKEKCDLVRNNVIIIANEQEISLDGA